MTKTLEELDALAASEILGWTLVNTDTSTAGDLYKVWFDGPETKYCFNSWSPTTRIEQAFQLITKLKSSQQDFIIRHCDFNGEWQVDYGTIFTGSDDPAMAITRACLKAKGINIE